MLLNLEAKKVRANTFKEKYVSLLFSFEKLKSKQRSNAVKGIFNEDQPRDLHGELEANNRKNSTKNSLNSFDVSVTISNANEVINRKNSLNTHNGAATNNNATSLFDIHLGDYGLLHEFCRTDPANHL